MIAVYSADWCGFCHMVKQYFDKLGVKYEEKNVESDPQALNESVQKSGQRGIPVIDIDGTIIVGFNRPAIDQALQAKKLI
jgi:glutaredoxin 3